jgi:uncharacterized protein YbjT (DUF2867 family)
MRILFIGASGLLGRPTARKMIEAGLDVTCMVRNPSRAFLPDGVKVVEGDLQDPFSLTKALEGIDAVYLNLSVKPNEHKSEFHAETDGLLNLLPAMKKAGVKQVGFISSLVMNYQGQDGFKWWVFELKHEAIRILKESGIPYFIFYPSSFMENFSRGGYLKGKNIVLAGKSKHKMYWISANDYGEMVAHAYKKYFGESHEFVIQGSEAFTAQEAAKIFARSYLNSRLRIIQTPLFPIKIAGAFVPSLDYISRIIQALNEYPETFQAETTWNLLGKPKTTLRKFALELS